MKSKFLANFVENGIYHVYNRTNNKELLFKTDENRLFFLRQYAKYLEPYLDTFCWALLPNHFHFLVRVKSGEDIKSHLKSIPSQILKPNEKEYLHDSNSTELLIEFEWKRFFTSYSMAFNKQHQRTGNLFHRPFKRLQIDKESHFTQTIIYIHANPLKHKIFKDFMEYNWSSWKSIVSVNPTKLNRQEVLDWFGGLESFIDTHKNLTKYYYTEESNIEDN